MEVIKIKNLTKVYKKKVLGKNFLKNMFTPTYSNFLAVNDISLNVNEGESIAFLGPNGAGKTTTIKLLTGLMAPTEGRIEVLGFTPFKKESEYLKQIGLVMGSKNGLSWDLTVEQNFWILQKIYQINQSQFDHTVKEMVEMLSIQDQLGSQVRKLSLGQRMKAELIASLLHSPKVLFLDEPTIGLDITTKKIVRDFLRRIQRKSKVTILLTSHDMDDVEEVSDRVVVINNGAISVDLPLKELMMKYNNHRYINVMFKNGEDFALLDLTKFQVESKILDSTTVQIKVSSVKYKELLAYILTFDSVKDIDLLSTPLDQIIGEIFNVG